jgi:hypothetical protein
MFLASGGRAARIRTFTYRRLETGLRELRKALGISDWDWLDVHPHKNLPPPGEPWPSADLVFCRAKGEDCAPAQNLLSGA